MTCNSSFCYLRKFYLNLNLFHNKSFKKHNAIHTHLLELIKLKRRETKHQMCIKMSRSKRVTNSLFMKNIKLCNNAGNWQFVNKVKYRYLSKIKTYLQKDKGTRMFILALCKKSMLNCQSKTMSGFWILPC